MTQIPKTLSASKNQQSIEDDPIEVRKAKRAALIASGQNPYGHAFDYTHHAAELDDIYASLENGASTDDEVRVAGRIMARRVQGKISFFTLQDTSGDIQLFCRINTLGECAYAQMKDLDVGDWVGVSGTMMRTKRGQLSVAVHDFELLSKSLRPLPEKFHGLADKEMRYRQRYVDLIMNRDVRDTFETRFRIISAGRRYLEDQGFFEVETPFLHSIVGGANAKPFITHFNALDRDYYLRIATELPLKRLLVGGFERVFEIGRQFRNEGMDSHHNPEFTTMEAYQAFTDLEGMKRLTQGFIQAAAQAACNTLHITYQGHEIDLSGTWRSASMIELVEDAIGEHVGFDLERAQLVDIAQRHGVVSIEDAWGPGKIISEIFEAIVEDTLIQPIFVCEHPVEISPLAKREEHDANLAQRFELFICGHEYANAFNEINDPLDQAERFHAQVKAKNMGDDETMGFDSDYIRALEYGMPPAGGVGIGIDRLVMLLTDSDSIRDVLLFPHMREEPHVQLGTHGERAVLESVPSSAQATTQIKTQLDQSVQTDDVIDKQKSTLKNTSELSGKTIPAHDTERADTKAHGSFMSDIPPAPKPGQKLDAGISRATAYELLLAHNKNAFHIKHGETLEALMRYYAQKYDPENVEFWGIVGLLHDLDWEEFPTAEDHTIKSAEMLIAAGVNPLVIRCIQTHNCDALPELPQPEAKMEKVLYATDELSGLIQAAIKMRPSRSVQDFSVKSLKKKYKDKSFAAGCNRQTIARGAEMNGMELAELFASVIEAMKEIDPDKDTFVNKK